MLSALLYTQALAMYDGEGGNPLEGGTEERIERRMGDWYVGRGEALWMLAEEKEVFGCFDGGGTFIDAGGSVRSAVSDGVSTGGGIYGAIARDARMALECERISACKRTLLSGGKARQEEGAVVRSKALCLVGYSLLRRGIIEGVSDAFEGSIDVAKLALQNNLEDKKKYDHLQHTITRAKAGLADLGRYEMLSTRLKKENRSRHNIYLHDLADMLKLSPASEKWNMEMVRFLIYQRRWYAVANYCERMASKVLEVEGVFEGDLREFHTNPGISSGSGELTPDFFEKTEERRDSSSSSVMPSYLRVVSDKAAADVALRLSEAILPIYIRALRLEERFNAANCVASSLVEMGGWRKECADAEMPLLQRTIKLKEDGDAAFQDGYYERAAGLYEQCLKVDADTEEEPPGGKLHAVLHANRASCFSSLGRYDDAVSECSAAIGIHSMYMKAILRRARCHAKAGDLAQAKEDYQRWSTLVEKARRQPYPAINIGPACYFDMPSEVKSQEWHAVKSEMTELGISITSDRRQSSARMLRSSMKKMTSSRSKESRSKKTTTKREGLFSRLKSGCCKKNVRSQVVEGGVGESEQQVPTASVSGSVRPPSKRSVTSSNSRTSLHAPPPHRCGSLSPTPSYDDGGLRDPSISSHDLNDRPDPPISNPSMINASQAGFDHPLDPPTAIDSDVDYYEILELDSSASLSNIKKSYHRVRQLTLYCIPAFHFLFSLTDKVLFRYLITRIFAQLAKQYHPDRKTGSEQKFQELQLAYEILGDKSNKFKYDKARMGIMEP